MEDMQPASCGGAQRTSTPRLWLAAAIDSRWSNRRSHLGYQSTAILIRFRGHLRYAARKFASRAGTSNCTAVSLSSAARVWCNSHRPSALAASERQLLEAIHEQGTTSIDRFDPTRGRHCRAWQRKLYANRPAGSKPATRNPISRNRARSDTPIKAARRPERIERKQAL
jgi:hypothetical protein